MAGTIVRTTTAYFQAMQEQFKLVDPARIDAYADLIFDAWKNDRRVFVFGNGGSAFTASHHVADYVKTASIPGQKRLQAFSLADNTGLLTALGNDVSYDDIFLYPLETYARPGDIAVGISCSGNSPNVVKALEWARKHGLATVAITGFAGGKIGSIAQLHINFPSQNFGVIEDLQMSVGHIAAQSLSARVAELAAKSAAVGAHA